MKPGQPVLCINHDITHDSQISCSDGFLFNQRFRGAWRALQAMEPSISRNLTVFISASSFSKCFACLSLISFSVHMTWHVPYIAESVLSITNHQQ